MSQSIVTENLKDWALSSSFDKSGEQFFSADNVIDAYFSGKKDGNEERSKILREKFSQNLTTAIKAAEQLFSEIIKEGFTCDKVFLKSKNVSHFTALFVVNEDNYLDDSFLKIYDKSIDLKRSLNNTETFDFSTIFTPNSSSLKAERLSSDGYILSYAGTRVH